MSTKRFGYKLFYLCMALIMTLSLAAPSAALAQDSTQFTAESLSPDSVISYIKATAGGEQPGMASVVVKLTGDALASYQGGVAGLAATSPSKTGAKKLNVNTSASQAYLNISTANIKSLSSRSPRASLPPR